MSNYNFYNEKYSSIYLGRKNKKARSKTDRASTKTAGTTSYKLFV